MDNGTLLDHWISFVLAAREWVYAAFMPFPLLILVGFVVAVVFMDAGRAYGLPRLFWHEKKPQQFAAGMAVAVLVLEMMLVACLLESKTTNSAIRFEHYWPGLRPVWILYLNVIYGAFLVFGLMVLIRLVWRRQTKGFLHDAAHKGRPFLLGIGAGLAAVTIMFALVSPVESWLEDTTTRLRGWFGREKVGANNLMHVIAACLFLVVALWYWISGRCRMPLATAATAVCMLLGLVAAVYGILAFNGVPPISLVIVGGLIMWLRGRDRFRIRVPILQSQYAKPVDLQNYEGTNDFPCPPLPVSQSQEKRPLVIVCASGGGLRAAVWTSHVLRKLELEIEGFPYDVRMIFGASGGMLGAAHYVSTLISPEDKGGDSSKPHWRHLCDSEEFMRQMECESLTDTVRSLVFFDLPRLGAQVKDRGQALEAKWLENMPNLGMTFDELRCGESDGWRPSLVFSPMLIEDGRRLFISNAKLGSLATAHGSEIKSTALPNSELYSRSAFEYRSLFPEEFPQTPLSTAARLSATFPYVTPAVTLPTNPRRRVVDAGYYDNYGVSLAASWLEECKAKHPCWLKENFSKVAIVQIRDGVRDLTVPLNEIGHQEEPSIWLRGLEGLSGPMQAIMTARESTTLLRNDEILELLLPRLVSAGFAQKNVTTVSFESGNTASLSWYLSGAELADLKRDADEAIKGKIAAFKAWWP